MKFIANPNKFIFAVGVGVIGIVLIICASVISKVQILGIVLAPWLFVSALLAMSTHVSTQ